MIQFDLLCKVVLTFESVEEILKSDPWNENYQELLSCDVVIQPHHYQLLPEATTYIFSKVKT